MFKHNTYQEVHFILLATLGSILKVQSPNQMVDNNSPGMRRERQPECWVEVWCRTQHGSDVGQPPQHAAVNKVPAAPCWRDNEARSTQQRAV